MKRFPCIRDTPRCMKIYDSHSKLLAEFKPEEEKINLHDQKNDKVQYTICRKPHTQSSHLSYNLLQEDAIVAEVTPASTNQHLLTIKIPKYGSNIQIIFENKTDFHAERDGNKISSFVMTSETTGYLDIAKGERRNFSFAFIALFVFWCEEVAQPASGGGIKEVQTSRSKSKSRKKSGREEKSKEKERSTSSKKITKISPPPDPDISEKSEESDHSENSEKSDSSSNNDIKKSRKSDKSRTTVLTSARTQIPIRSTSAIKSPRTDQISTRRDQSSNSVLNALIKKKSAGGNPKK